MQTSVKIAFRHCEPSEEIRAEIAAQMEGLEQLSPRITSCRIVVSGPKTRHKRGALFHIQLRVAMPERKDVVVDQREGDAGESEHPLVAIRDSPRLPARSRTSRATCAARSRPTWRKATAASPASPLGTIAASSRRRTAAKTIFINAVLNGGFARLSVGSEVRFIEEDGEKGAQASTVRLVGKHHLA